MTKDELNQYRSLICEIEKIECKLESFNDHATVKSSSHPPYAQRVVTVNGIRVGHRKEILRLRSLRTECLAKCRKIESFIYGIDDSLTRRIFEYRYIEGLKLMSWQSIATEIGESDECYPRRKHNRYLKLAENAEKYMV